MQIEKNIAATLRHRMEAEKKSKLEFSKELGIPRSTFQGYLKGENCLRSDSIEEIAKGLNITPAQLISGPEDAAAEVKARAGYICPQRGGEGAVRGAVEKILRGDGRWKGAGQKGGSYKTLTLPTNREVGSSGVVGSR